MMLISFFLLVVTLSPISEVLAAKEGDVCKENDNTLCDTPDTGLACIDGTCSTCRQVVNTTADSLSNKGCGDAFVCSLDTSVNRNTCSRAPLFSSQTAGLTWAGAVFLFMGSSLAAGGGLGGGGIFVPLLILMVGLSPKEAVPLSQAMIFGGSLVNLAMNYRSRHPIVKTRPLIDYDAVLILEPLMLLGTTIGVFLNTVSPTWLIVVTLVIVIGYGAKRTTCRGIRQWRKERAAADRKKKKELDASGLEITVVAETEENPSSSMLSQKDEVNTVFGPAIVVKTARSTDNVVELQLKNWILANKKHPVLYAPAETLRNASSGTIGVEEGPPSKVGAADLNEQRKIAQEEAQQLPRLAAVLGMLVLIVVISLIRGGKAGAASIVGIENCSGGYWGVTAAMFVVLVLLAILVGNLLSKKHARKIACNYEFVEGDIMWTGRNIYLYPALSGFAGMFGGLLGIGGGMIMGPLLLELGMLPNNTQATSATTVMITSGAAMFQFLFLGMLIPDYGIFFALMGFVATFFGQTALDYLVKKYNTTSFIVFSIALVMIIAVILMAVAGILRIVAEIENGTGGGFTNLC